MPLSSVLSSDPAGSWCGGGGEELERETFSQGKRSHVVSGLRTPQGTPTVPKRKK